MPRTVAHVLADSLVAHGVDRVFCVPGESYIGFTNALLDVEGCDLVVCRHEAGAGLMAIADGQLTGRPGCAIVSRGPGMANGMIALHTALHDCKPLVMLVGHVERKDIGRQALQEQNYAVWLADVTKRVIEVVMPDQISEAVARAFHYAESGTPGPVAVVLPEDIFDEPTEVATDKPRPRPVMEPGAGMVAAFAGLLAASERPMLWVGATMPEGAEMARKLETLAEAWSLPIHPTMRRPHLFDFNHPNFGGYVGIRPPKDYADETKRTDLLVAFGERLMDTTSQSYTFPAAPQPQVPFVHIWPDADELGRVWRPDHAFACDPGAMLDALLALDPPPPSNARKKWVAGLNEKARALLAPEWELQSDGVNFAAVCCAVDRHLAPNAAITSDAGNFGSFVHRYLHFRPEQTFLSSIIGAMGAGVPMGVAAAMRDPDRQVVVFVGDGGILMTGNELATARLHGANPIIVLSDNATYSTINMHHHVRYPGHVDETATALMNPDFCMWAESFGAASFLIDKEADVDGTIAEAFAVKGRPVLVHVKSSAKQMSAYRNKDMYPPAAR
jgi:acetolactate synthase-1/2/3 large subunit